MNLDQNITRFQKCEFDWLFSNKPIAIICATNFILSTLKALMSSLIHDFGPYGP